MKGTERYPVRDTTRRSPRPSLGHWHGTGKRTMSTGLVSPAPVGIALHLFPKNLLHVSTGVAETPVSRQIRLLLPSFRCSTPPSLSRRPSDPTHNSSLSSRLPV